jgi:hypothetical protein
MSLKILKSTTTVVLIGWKDIMETTVRDCNSYMPSLRANNYSLICDGHHARKKAELDDLVCSIVLSNSWFSVGLGLYWISNGLIMQTNSFERGLPLVSSHASVIYYQYTLPYSVKPLA